METGRLGSTIESLGPRNCLNVLTFLFSLDVAARESFVKCARHLLSLSGVPVHETLR